MKNVDAITYKCQCRDEAIVDIIMLAYNHEEYIEDAIESVLMQQTQYLYKLVIGEDCSTDNTRKIVINYYNQYPDKIELLLWKKNIGMKKNSYELIQNSHSKYIACLEGDDYWTDPLKLQKQISFLERHEGFIGTVHNVRCVDAKGSFLHKDFNLYPIREGHIYGKEQVKNFELASQTASLVHRNIWKEFDRRYLEQIFLNCQGNSDLKINLLLGIRGDIYYFREIMADHRRVFRGDSWTAKTNKKNMLLDRYLSIVEIQRYIKEILKDNCNIDNILHDIYEECLIRVLCECNIENINIFVKVLKKEIVRMWKKTNPNGKE